MTQPVLRYSQGSAHDLRYPAPSQSQTFPVFTIMGSFALALCPSGGAQAQPVGSAYLKSTGPSASALARKEDATAPEMISEIKKTAGLTWAQIASIFGVAPKSVHNWMNGEGMSDKNRHILIATLDIVRKMAGERGYKIRNALLSGKGAVADPDFDGPLVVSDNTPARNRPTQLVGSTKSG